MTKVTSEIVPRKYDLGIDSKEIQFEALKNEIERLHSENDQLRKMLELARVENVKLNEKINDANIDPLTGLMNRRLFYENSLEIIEKARRNNFPVTVWFLDLVGFKEVNDQLGHDKGDELLERIGPYLRKTMRDDDIIGKLEKQANNNSENKIQGRYGGDEFVLLTVSNEDDNSTILSRIKNSFENEFPELKGVSVGWAIVEPHLTPNKALDEAIKKADATMYEDKRVRKEESIEYHI